MITALDHIAIAVPDLEKAIKRFVEDFGLPMGGTEDVLEAKTTAAFLPLPPTNIELVYPLNGEGPVATYLEKKRAVDCTTYVSARTISMKMWPG